MWFLVLGALGVWGLISLRRIPNDPPHVGVVTVLGRRTNRIVREGLAFLPFFPIVSAIKVNVKKQPQDLPPIKVRTPDNAELEISVGLTWTPDQGNMLNYLNSGRETGVNDILTDIVSEKLREWAAAADTEPKTWQKAIQMHDDAVAAIVQAVVGAASSAGLVDSLRKGNGVAQLSSLGIVLNRVNVKEVRILGDLAKAAEQAAKEDSERAAERKEAETITLLVEEFAERIGVSPERFLELSQTERGKIKKEVRELKVNIPPEILEKAGEILNRLLSKKEDN